MTPERYRQVQVVFAEAAAHATADRAAALEAACDGDAELRAEVESLLAADADAAPLLGATLSELAAVLTGAPADAAPGFEGRTIGPYRVVREIGRGGMGTVYLAERADVRMRVALKLVRDPLAAPERVGRFLLERRVLARLDHPHIARLLDAGVTEAGTPWFAMELVDGEPIDRACDTRRLTLPERLALFEKVCEAVQYAHERLVVHRDLKPSNILVAANGDVKLLDFGIAKLLDDADGDDDGGTRTQTGVRLLTPSYAAPEQLRGEPVTTATDVYALGVVLYELLAGRRPHERRGARGACAPAPTRPSAVVSHGAATRGTTTSRFARQLRGDLDTVVLKALADEPARRYASAQQLLDDLRNYRAGRPVAARPDTRSYRARRFVSRNRGAVGALTALLLVLASVAGVTSYQHAALVRERDRAREEAARGRRGATFFGELLMAATPAGIGPNGTVSDLLDLGTGRADTLAGDPELRAWMLTALGFAYLDRGAYAQARAPLESALTAKRRLHAGDHVDVGQSLMALGRLLAEQGDLPAAERLLREQVAMDRRLPGDGQTDLVKGLTMLGSVLHARGDVPAAERTLREAIERADRLREPTIWWARALGALGAVHHAQGRTADAEAALARGMAMVVRVRGPAHPELFAQLGALAAVRQAQGRAGEAETLARGAAAGARRALGPTHPKVATALHALALVRRARGDARGAETAYREALAVRRASLPPGSALTAATLGALGGLLVEEGRASEAEPLLREALDVGRRMLTPTARATAEAERALAACLAALGRPGEGDALLAQVPR